MIGLGIFFVRNGVVLNKGYGKVCLDLFVVFDEFMVLNIGFIIKVFIVVLIGVLIIEF